MDSAFGTTFDAHVIAGYRFLMKYYTKGSKIYMFGFSRGAFTARFLARMVHTVGLLSEGNEEMVPFAYELYQQYEQGKIDALDAKDKHTTKKPDSSDGVPANAESTPLIRKPTDETTHVHGEGSDHDEGQCKRNKIYAFRDTFCRQETIDGKLRGIKVYFLGIFDCVSSVSVLDSPFGKAPIPVSVMGTADHVRHAVAVDEHRVKFKAALLDQDYQDPTTKKSIEDIKEVWFPGNHGDVGGGWPAVRPEEKAEKIKWWHRVKKIFFKEEDKETSVAGTDPYQMSDIPLAWMVRELEEIGEQDKSTPIQWSPRRKGFKDHFYKKGINEKQSLKASMHDTLKVGKGSSLLKVMMWNLMGE